MSAQPMSVNAPKTRLLAAQLSDIAMAMDHDIRDMGLGVSCIAELRENPDWEGENSHLNIFNNRTCNFKSS